MRGLQLIQPMVMFMPLMSVKTLQGLRATGDRIENAAGLGIVGEGQGQLGVARILQSDVAVDLSLVRGARLLEEVSRDAGTGISTVNISCCS